VAPARAGESSKRAREKLAAPRITGEVIRAAGGLVVAT
jgi:hypothetical protein